jgi:hypothetical protein
MGYFYINGVFLLSMDYFYINGLFSLLCVFVFTGAKVNDFDGLYDKNIPNYSLTFLKYPFIW